MKVAVIGAGPAGLVSLKYALDAGHECDVFEQSNTIGGTWVYTEELGTEENGFTYGSMYKELKTNIPKEIMTFLDFPYQDDVIESMIGQPQVLQYLTDYANRFQLKKHIQCNKRVTKVEPQFDKWIVTVADVNTKEDIVKCYDAVFVCSGMCRYPEIPQIPGQNLFKGLQMHSRDYRTPNSFENKQILVIGASFSAKDIATQISALANVVIYMSHWDPIIFNIPNAIIKPTIAELYENGATFQDGTKEDFDVVLYCTGYKYFFPFLTNNCGITIEDNWVRSLYKHVINIERPTLCFIGIPTFVASFPICDIQARFALATLEKTFQLPSKSEMMKALEDYILELKENNVPQRHIHKIGFAQTRYTTDLVQTAGIRPIPPVINRLHYHESMNWIKLLGSRRYKLLDDHNYIEC